MYVRVDEEFGKWTVLEDGLLKHQKVKCQCECGKIKEVFVHNLVNNESKQCGSCRTAERNRKNAKHGLRNHPLYGIWRGMRRRCNNPSDSGYKNYGQRGIRVCKSWNENFIEFYNWAIENNYEHSAALEIDRIDNNGNYSCGKCEECLEKNWKLNCRWVTPKVNSNNRRSSHIITAFGENKTISEWSEDARCVVTYGTLMQRIHRDIDPESAITVPDLGYSGRFGNLNKKPLTESDVLEIRKLFCTGNFSQTQLNKQFDTMQVPQILSGKYWSKTTANDGLQEKINLMIESKKHFVTEEIEARIVELGKTKKYKQSEIAKIVGFHQSHVSKVLIKNGITTGRGKKTYEIQPPTDSQIF